MEEFQIWSIWSSNRIGSGLVGIGSILGVWLSMRIAVASRNSDESNLFSKIVSSAFGLVTLSFCWINFTTIANTWIAAARNLTDLKASGTEISSTADGYRICWNNRSTWNANAYGNSFFSCCHAYDCWSDLATKKIKI
jgi:hypothetical protein